MTAEAFISRLHGVRSRGTGRWSATCPAHADKTPSLAIAEGERGVLLRCWAGCSLQDICAALNIQQRDLFFDSRVDLAAKQRRNAERLEREQQQERDGLHLDQLREAEHLLRVARGISIGAMSADQLDHYLHSIADAHDLLLRDMGEEEYAVFCLSLG